MTDHELIEAAAKAAGVKYDPEASKPHPKSGAFWGLWLTFDHEPSEYDRRYWNPLNDDGDALRLAVKLGMTVVVDLDDGCTRILNEFEGVLLRHMHFHDGPGKSTRHAIVRAAASCSTYHV